MALLPEPHVVGHLKLLMRQAVRRLRPKLRRLIRRSWFLSRCYYRYQGARLLGRPGQEVWYFAYGANMDDGTFRARRGIQALEWSSRPHQGYRLRFNLDGRPKGKAAPANLHPDPGAEVWGVLYRITRRDLLRLDSTEGVPGRGYRHIEIAAEDRNGRVVQAVTLMAQGNEVDGKPSLRYITLLRNGASPRTARDPHPVFGEGRSRAVNRSA